MAKSYTEIGTQLLKEANNNKLDLHKRMKKCNEAVQNLNSPLNLSAWLGESFSGGVLNKQSLSSAIKLRSELSNLLAAQNYNAIGEEVLARNPTLALEKFNKAIEYAKDDPVQKAIYESNAAKALNKLGEQELEGNPAEALQKFYLAVDYAEDDSVQKKIYKSNVAKALNAQGKIYESNADKAKELADRPVELGARDAHLRTYKNNLDKALAKFNLAIIYAEDDPVQEAIYESNEVKVLNKLGEHENKLGEHELEGNPEEALEKFYKAIEYAKDDPVQKKIYESNVAKALNKLGEQELEDNPEEELEKFYLAIVYAKDDPVQKKICESNADKAKELADRPVELSARDAHLRALSHL